MSVEAAYVEVERLTKREARNFAYGIRVLPKDQRRAISAIYAFARRVDDVADGELPVEQKRERLHALRDTLDSPSSDPVFVALADARSRYGIPDGALNDLVDGGLLPGIVDFFSEGVAAGKGVLELIGTDVAAFCDDLIKDSRTYADVYQESLSGKPGTDRK